MTHVEETFPQTKSTALNSGNHQEGSQVDFVMEVPMSDQYLCGYI